MKWYNFVACFFMGVFLINSIPHLIHAISGEKFPTPFANPPGKGLSSPMLNLVWAFINLFVCYLLFRASKINPSEKWSLILFALGFIAMSIRLCYALSKVKGNWQVEISHWKLEIGYQDILGVEWEIGQSKKNFFIH